MKIAQVSPLYESVPPRSYGGTERVVSYLTEELVRQGHDVTLFASGDSTTRARLVACCPKSLRLDEACLDPLPHHFVMLSKVFEAASRFDVIHFHTDYLHFPFWDQFAVPSVTTLHGRLDIPDLLPLYKRFCRVPLVSISDAQRKPVRFANWQRTIYHGLPEDLYVARERAGEYLAFLGRISPEKRIDRAIEIAKRAGMKLRVAAKIDKADQEYYRAVARPLLEDPAVEFLGEIGEAEKNHLLGNAYAFLFPIDWPEPFGLVMIEAMACGTPVVAFRGGSVEEVIDEGVTGFVVETVEGAVAALDKVSTLDRRMCRQVFEERFSAKRMAEQYLAVYQKILNRRARPFMTMSHESFDLDRELVVRLD
jgi:glycosyltransferase involved in cell wall biosynthesis